MSNNQIYYNRMCTTIAEICEILGLSSTGDGKTCKDETGNVFEWANLINRTLASEEFYK